MLSSTELQRKQLAGIQLYIYAFLHFVPQIVTRFNLGNLWHNRRY